MTVEPVAESVQAETKKKAAKAPTVAAPLRKGDTVIYVPSTTQANALRSLKGVRHAEFVALITDVRDARVDLWVLPPHGLQPFPRSDVGEGEGPNTFRRRD